jgi:hypothetical protein
VCILGICRRAPQREIICGFNLTTNSRNFFRARWRRVLTAASLNRNRATASRVDQRFQHSLLNDVFGHRIASRETLNRSIQTREVLRHALGEVFFVMHQAPFTKQFAAVVFLPAFNGPFVQDRRCGGDQRQRPF